MNLIHCEDNVDNGTKNQWDNGHVGNYWSACNGNDVDPLDGIGDVPYYLTDSASSCDTRPLTDSLDGDIDGDGLSNREEFFSGVDGYMTNPSNHDSDHDGLSDYWEWKNIF